MKLLLTVIRNDLKNIFRDKTLFIMFFLPILFVALCRYGVPFIPAGLIPGLEEYYWLIVAGFTCVSASTPSFLIGFILLDERDENVHTLLKILPLPENFIIKCRTGFMIIAGFIFSLSILLFNGLITLSYFQLMIISILYSLIPPILTFSVASLAKNKIEAATIYKGMSLFLVLPITAFFINSDFKYGFGIIPFFWTYNAFQLNNEILPTLLNFFGGLLTHSIFIWIFYTIYRRKIQF